MEYRDWAPVYDRIREEFGFPFEREVASADCLEARVAERLAEDPLECLRAVLGGRTVVVCGLAPGAGAPPLWRLPADRDAPVLIAADGATEACLAAALVPTIIVTDLDGPVVSEVAAHRRGSRVVIHAHGDNRPAIEEWADQFPGILVGSWAGPPRPRLLNVGGFTDGDRAVLLAEHVGATRILLWGFDFRRVNEPDPIRRARKLAKLAWARRIVSDAARRRQARIELWRPDGRLGPYGAGEAESTTR
ncbi:MAG: 6-hydroxymethylpterin diphosphokinase MptE-like protein [Thermoplasmata archaeon]